MLERQHPILSVRRSVYVYAQPQHIPWHAPRKYYEMYDRDMPLPMHDHTPVGIPPYALTDTWHAVYIFECFPYVCPEPVLVK